MKGISRIDSPRCHGWLVRIYRNGRTYSRLFSDGKYGGRGPALQTAKTYLRGRESSLPPSRPFRPWPILTEGRLLPGNRSGTNGVSVLRGSGKKKNAIIGFSASYKLGGKPNSRRFLVSRYGSKSSALKAAVSFRKKMEKDMMREWESSSRDRKRE